MNNRLLICSLRKLRKQMYRCFDYEFEDVIAELEDADFIYPEPRGTSEIWTSITESISRKSLSIPWNPAFRFPSIEKTYDCFLTVIMFAYDLDILARMPDWTSKVGYSICYIDELFIRSLEQYPKSLRILERFDLLVLNCSGTQGDISRIVSISTTVVSSGIDAMRFRPQLPAQKRKIDLYNMGRRDEGLHLKLLELAKNDHWLYLYDTTKTSDVHKPEDHRIALASRLQHTTFFMVNPAKFDNRRDAGDQEEIGFRYFEGSAAGAVMIGRAPNNPLFKNYFPWKDAVIELPENHSEAIHLLRNLRCDEERLNRITFENVKGALERHDFVYRWEEILEAAEIDLLPTVRRRKEQLDEQRDDWVKQYETI